MARSLNKAKKTKKEGRNSMAENIVFQILRSHLMEGELTPGTPIAIRVDQTLGHDLTGIMAGGMAVGAQHHLTGPGKALAVQKVTNTIAGFGEIHPKAGRRGLEEQMIIRVFSADAQGVGWGCWPLAAAA